MSVRYTWKWKTALTLCQRGIFGVFYPLMHFFQAFTQSSHMLTTLCLKQFLFTRIHKNYLELLGMMQTSSPINGNVAALQKEKYCTSVLTWQYNFHMQLLLMCKYRFETTALILYVLWIIQRKCMKSEIGNEFRCEGVIQVWVHKLNVDFINKDTSLIVLFNK